MMKMVLRGAGLAAILLTVSLGTRTAQGATCEGYCTVSCASGATNTYYEPNYWCCDHLAVACPDGSASLAAEWEPVTCGNHETC
jgi:hypothetical protein